ncbi:Hpt domain-containing protein [Leeia aquatica]|uniref:HPt domain-containing protein n=1 Tax=Leeia aquatica TaxID=2725557 RepID=A0A847SCG1_9NEIS|nr:Hpt domain-containing protein [Leeia aquatica]NLR76547.1 hypothetical protein [Leeia aquatica]
MPLQDYQAFAATLGLPEDMLPDMAGILLEQLPEQWRLLQHSVSSHDHVGTFQHAHSYKGSVGSLTDGPLWQLARTLESTGRQQGEWPEIEALLAQMVLLHQQFMAEMRQLADGTLR